MAAAITSAAALAIPAAVNSAGDEYLTPDDVINMESARGFSISPDGDWVAWVKTVPNKAKNTRNGHVYITRTGEDVTLQLTRGNVSDSSPKFSPDGERLAFLGKRGEKAKTQIYILDLRGGEAQKITSTTTGVRAYEWLADDSFIFTAREDSTFREMQLRKDKDDVVVVSDQEHYMPVRLFLS